MSDRYGSDVLAGDWKKPKHGRAVETPAELGAVVEALLTTDPSTSSGHRFVGEIVRIDRDLHTLTLEDRKGKRRTFPLGPGFWLEGKPVILTPPVTRTAPAKPTRTASGSVAVDNVKARVARESRIFVEGRHDAELVEKIWGDDLRIEGVVVEYLGGVDDLADHLVDFRPSRERRVGVLVDHLVKGSKEARIAESIRRSKVGEHVLIVGHPFIDVWQAVKPARLGLEAWPNVPRSIEWKKGICQHMGWPHRDQADIARAWKHILGRVTSFGDLEPALLGRVEELIDFVTEPV
ncbi:DUF3097 domain-containing protein [Nocardioides sp. NPDC057577]|uniref:DUF3097 domain-containing protein n=1 Tax=Nocardioides sp. NPDC057577 TaxID=3346171 RepID=UPI0036722CC7